MGLIFDLDQTLVDSRPAEQYRTSRNWSMVYSKIPSFELYEGIRELLQKLSSKSIPISIVTSSPSTYCSKVLTHFGFAYDYIVCYHDTPKRKPYPDPINLAVHKMGISPNNCFSLGDKSIDIEASNSAGVISCACLWGSDEKEVVMTSNPKHIFTTVNDCSDFFNSHFNL